MAKPLTVELTKEEKEILYYQLDVRRVHFHKLLAEGVTEAHAEGIVKVMTVLDKVRGACLS